MKKHNLLDIIILMFTCAAVISCGLAQPINSEEYVQFRIKKINFEKGNWSYFNNSDYDIIELSNSVIRDFKRTIKLDYDVNTVPFVPIIDEDLIHIKMALFQYNYLRLKRPSKMLMIFQKQL